MAGGSLGLYEYLTLLRLEVFFVMCLQLILLYVFAIAAASDLCHIEETGCALLAQTVAANSGGQGFP